MVSAHTDRAASTNRRQFLSAVGAAVSATALAGCSALGGGDSDSAKLGLLTSLSGPTAATGQEIERGAEMAREHLDGEILDSEYELVVQDTASEPSTALDGARTLVEQENVDAIIGPSLSSSTISVIPYVQEEAQIPIIPTQASSNDAREGDNCSDYSFFLFPSNKHTVQAGTDFLYEMPDLVDRDFDHTRMHFFSPDYALGQNNLELLEDAVSDRGGEVTGSTLVPLGTQDLSSYISELSQTDADVITGVMTPGMAIRLIQQAQDYDLKEEKVMMFNSGKPVNQTIQASVGAAADGWYGTTFYNPVSDREINQTFRDLYPADSDLLPNASCASGFEGVRALAKGMEEAGTTNGDDVIDSLSGMNWDSVYGDSTFRESDGQIDLDFVGATRRDSEFVSLAEYPGVIPDSNC
ncbi:ABC transporter substrate-binding protein [Halobacterium bonnevillei]|uniref:ABC transporter substrate-binding protein n=1 Tax=Halobacterium bonnevillei TaxID=2692200 RepID=A0A6B0SD49_9EURY|nr:ABC transporter substrate-binding protein [Halobacterium bonnevillei]MXR19318.1 ABC transporter substrate-binding protein [Halobacterium bonnevillei]